MANKNTLSPALRAFAAAFPDKVIRALSVEVELMTTLCRRRTPVDTGALVGTVHMVGPKREGRGITAAIVAGGPAAPYAIYVHENLRAKHPVGQAKYIESVIMEARPYLAQRVADRVELR